ncbi:MAG: glycosyltransferase family 2 protein [Muribaculaceae bacterium]|nr:glycosyltransferase family 2 protein [Muribaculaceae bacterium]
MDQLTATIIALNEERRLGACLESLRGVADEVIVVDSFSTDRTLDICREYGCRITQRRFDGFGTQRQYATSLATHRFILSIDADEVLSPALRSSIIKLKEEGFAHRIYSISRLNFYCGYPVRHCGWYPDYHIRLFDKRYANWNLHDVGEKVIFRDSVTPQPIDGDILHYRCETREQFQAVTRSHATIKARVLAATNESIPAFAPWLHGLKAWWHTFISEGGILEGNAGREIAAESYRSEYLAYSAARKLK